MMRFSVRVAFGLIVSLSISSVAAAQVVVVPFATKARDPLLNRAFSGVTFGATAPAPQPNAMPRLDPTPRPDVAPKPDAAPQPDAAARTKAAPPCVMRVVPVDPQVTSGMPIVSVDERADPKSVVKIPACQPRD